jgi:hypothetical protein
LIESSAGFYEIFTSSNVVPKELRIMKCKETSFRGLRLERVVASKQFDGSTFKNPTGKSAGLKGNPLPVLGEFFFGGGQRMPPGPLPIARGPMTHGARR